jgi:hypothetical protein
VWDALRVVPESRATRKLFALDEKGSRMTTSGKLMKSGHYTF